MLHMFSHIRGNNMFQMFQLFQSYVAVSIFMLQVANVSSECCICFKCMLQVYILHVFICCIRMLHSSISCCTSFILFSAGSDDGTAWAPGNGHVTSQGPTDGVRSRPTIEARWGWGASADWGERGELWACPHELFFSRVSLPQFIFPHKKLLNRLKPTDFNISGTGPVSTMRVLYLFELQNISNIPARAKINAKPLCWFV